MVGRALWFLLVTTLLVGCEASTTTTEPPPGDEEPPPPEWHINRIEHGLGDHVLSDVWGDARGNMYMVGQFGFIMTNRGPEGLPVETWTEMETPTQVHLTAIVGLETGAAFGLSGNDGDMIAVGWEGTVLHFHPDPDGNELTEDGAWSLVAGPEGSSFNALTRTDPACPDWDGDGIADDGDGSGFSGDATCTGGERTNCDDNCRQTANGPQRPLVDALIDGCIGPDDNPNPDPTTYQTDADGDGRGAVCDPDEESPAETSRFDAPLFAVWGERYEVGADQWIRVVAVGGGGAIVTFDGPSAGVDASPLVTDASAWIAQSGMTFRYDTDCDSTTPANEACPGSGRLAPSCPAQCHPRRTDCACPVDMGTCCDAGANTGVGCSDGSCPAAPNACDAASGDCFALCHGCLRRLGQTLRGVAGGDAYLVAVGADGNILVRDDITDPAGLWLSPTCVVTPEPLDERPLLASVSAIGDTFAVVGAAGGLLLVDPSGGLCAAREAGVPLTGGLLVESKLGLPAAYLASVWASTVTTSFVVGDGGLLLQIGGVFQVTEIDTGVEENLYDVILHPDPEPPGDPELWIVGADGVLLHGEYY